MIRYVAIGALTGLCALTVAFFVQRETLTAAKADLALCAAYKDQTNEVRDATSNLPTDPDAILDGLCRYTGGPCVGNP